MMHIFYAPASLGQPDCERIADATLAQPVLAVTRPIIALVAVCAAGLAQSRHRERRSAWVMAAGVFALGLAAYAAGRSGSLLCRPDALWQYHGAWHVISGAATGLAAWAMVAPRVGTITRPPDTA